MKEVNDGNILVTVSDIEGYRDSSSTIEELSVETLKSEVRKFLSGVGDVLASASELVPETTKLEEVTLSASIQAGGKLSLLGSGVETSAQACISFKFVFPANVSVKS